MIRSSARLVLIASLATALVAPGVGVAEPRERGGGRGPRGAASVVKVKMVDGERFRPARLEISRGTRVRWVNRDNVTHTTTSNDGLWDARVAPGDRFTRRFRRAGEFDYRCTIHAGMTGTIVVS